jgi:amino acid transporter
VPENAASPVAVATEGGAVALDTAAPPLKKDVTLVGIVAQSVGNMGVSAIVALLVPLVVVTAGAGSWLTWVICTVVILLVAWCISRLAQRFATSGGLYGLASKSLGSFGGFLTGWIMFCLIGLLGFGTIAGFGLYANQFLQIVGLHTGQGTLAATYFFALIVALVCSRIGMERAAAIMLGLEAVTIVTIVVVMIAVLVSAHGNWFLDHPQTTMQHSSLHLVFLGAVLAVLSFGGFESATVLGREAKNPLRAIPVAMIGTVLAAGAFWTFCSYTMYLGAQNAKINLATDPAPLRTLAEAAGVSGMRYVVDLTISLTLLASVIATFNAVTRLMFTLAREGQAPQSWKRTNAGGTPEIALYWLAVVWGLGVAVIAIANIAPDGVVEEFGDINGYAYIIMYALISIGALVYLRRVGSVGPKDIAATVLPVVALGYVLYQNVVPFPPYPDNVVLYVTIGGLAAIVAAYGILRWQAPQVLARVGSTVDQDTAEAAR